MTLLYRDGRTFATGVARFNFIPASKYDSNVRILVQVSIEGYATTAILDTGAPYVLCAPQLARTLDIDPKSAITRTKIVARNREIYGGLHKLLFKPDSSRG